ncbi:MAG: hypothetical protein M1823_005266 [Watsoniomyces obsoletus]|nr:MAG: hypothetical protein M1823_005266 [Watsoniomyces obsoletus]
MATNPPILYRFPAVHRFLQLVAAAVVAVFSGRETAQAVNEPAELLHGFATFVACLAFVWGMVNIPQRVTMVKYAIVDINFAVAWVAITGYFGYVLWNGDPNHPNGDRLVAPFVAEGYNVAAWVISYRMTMWYRRAAETPAVVEEIELQPV